VENVYVVLPTPLILKLKQLGAGVCDFQFGYSFGYISKYWVFFAQFFGHSVFNLIKLTKHICEQCCQLLAEFGSRFIPFAFLQWLN
jgi:hypothetical protein